MIQSSVLHNFTPSGQAVAILPVQCAWCLTEAKKPLGNGSHGICPEHKAVVLAAWRAKRKAGQA